MLAPLVAALALTAAPPAQRHPFTVSDLVATPRVASPSLSPDGRLIAFTVARPSADLSRLESALWTVATQGAVAPRRLTSAPGEAVSSPRFSPDGRRIAFVSTRAGVPQAFVLALDGGEAVQVTRLPTGVNDVLWAPDGAALLVTSDVDPACGADAACAEARERDAKGAPRVATRLLFRHWNAWRERLRSHVLRVPLDGGAAVDLTPGERDVPPFQRGDAGDLATSADGKELYFTVIAEPVEAISTNADLYAVPLAGGAPRRLTDGAGWDGTPRPSPDGKRLAWRSQARAGAESDRFRLMVGDAAGAGARDHTARVDHAVRALYWASPERIVFTAEEDGLSNVYEALVKEGEVRRLATAANIADLSPSRDGRAAAGVVDGLTRPAEVALLEGGKVRVLTHFGDELTS
ncbi:MAG: S9 family peptidase, partial [Anaeromyxobacteraceae bacterium]